MTEMKSPNVHAKKNRNDTPRKRKTHIIKVRVTAEEKLRIAYACKELHLTQSELVRRVLYGVNVKHTDCYSLQAFGMPARFAKNVKPVI